MAQSRLRFPLMALAMVAMLAALWAGLVRMGWRWPTLQPTLPIAHGPLMVSGFLGTLISVERAVALRKRWAYLGPALSALGGLVLIAGGRMFTGPLLITAGSLGLVIVFVVIICRHPANYTYLMGAGALAWLVGNLLWVAGNPVFKVISWWGAFLILTIAGERLELGRILRISGNAQLAFLGAIGLYIAGLITTTANFDTGTRLYSLGMLALAVWLLRYDIARKTLNKAGLPRFAAACLLSGYVWLAGAGVMGMLFGGVMAGVRYDAFLHAIFLGFVLSMIFGHAPIIFPAVLGFEVRFKRVYYLHLVLLHLSLGLRTYSDLSLEPTLRLWGGLLNGVAVLLFFGANAFTVMQRG